MTFVHWLVVASVCINIMGVAVYIRDTLAGRTKPNRISHFMWALSPFIGGTAALAVQAHAWATVRIFFAGIPSLLILIASFLSPKSYWKITKFDLACGACAVVALCAWAFIDFPRIAILLSAIGDGLASVPTLLKTWKYPETETAISFLACFVSVLLIIPSIPRWDIENSAFQIYLIVANGIFTFAVYRKRLSKFKKTLRCVVMRVREGE